MPFVCLKVLRLIEYIIKEKLRLNPEKIYWNPETFSWEISDGFLEEIVRKTVFEMPT